MDWIFENPMHAHPYMGIKKTNVSYLGDIRNTLGVGKVMKAQDSFIFFPFSLIEYLYICCTNNNLNDLLIDIKIITI